MGAHEDILIQKASGESEYFSFEKLRNSLLKSGATPVHIEEIINELKEQIHQGISTRKIYSMAYRMLKKQSKHTASRYYLKQGMMELGPSGFAFERYVSELFKFKGYHTQTGVTLQGKCVKHEVDVVSTKENVVMLMECKYKNQAGLAVDVKVPLYIRSRFNDILENGKILNNHKDFKGWIVTNSKFTEDALTYGNCAGLHLLSWDYPKSNSLKDIIDESGLYPLTCLSTLSQEEKGKLLAKNIVLVKDLIDNENLLRKIGITDRRIKNLNQECKQLCSKKV